MKRNPACGRSPAVNLKGGESLETVVRLVTLVGLGGRIRRGADLRPPSFLNEIMVGRKKSMQVRIEGVKGRLRHLRNWDPGLSKGVYGYNRRRFSHSFQRVRSSRCKRREKFYLSGGGEISEQKKVGCV